MTGEAEDLDVVAAIEALRGRGCARILTEGGPRLGSMLEASAVDELFLTLSPTLFGGGEGRPPLSGGAPLPDDDGMGARVVGVRRSDDHLFLRYDLRPPASA